MNPTPKNFGRWLAYAVCLMAALTIGIGAQAQSPKAAEASSTTTKSLRLQTLLSQYHAIGELNGVVLVADHGKVIYQGAFGLANREWSIPNSADTALRIASLTKQFTATLVMQLVEQGKVKLEDNIGMYIPDLRHDTGSTVTIHQLLNHTSGIIDYANFPGFWENRLGAKVSRAEYMDIMNRELEFTPGSSGKYNSSGFYLLGYVIEKVTGKTYEHALDDMILHPLRMVRSGYEAPDRIVNRRATGYSRAPGGVYESASPVYMANGYSAGGMYSTVGDFLIWDRALYGSTVLSESAKQRMFTPYAKDNVNGDLAFGYGWLVGTRKIGERSVTVHEHGGNTNGFRSLITRFTDDQRLIVILLNDGGGTITQGIYKLGAAITKVLYDLPVAPPQRSFADTLAQNINQYDVDTALSQFQQQSRSTVNVDGPNELNLLGYHYLSKGRLSEAVKVLQLNTTLFPTNGNCYDSLGEAYMAQGDMELAKLSYKRALELDASNTNASDILRKLEAK